jgi:hypothetical protein
LPISESCKFVCFTSKLDKTDKAWKLREELENNMFLKN